MGLREIKASLNKLEKEDQSINISELYIKYIPVKEYFDKEGIGSGFHDSLGDLYYQHYE